MNECYQRTSLTAAAGDSIRSSLKGGLRGVEWVSVTVNMASIVLGGLTSPLQMRTLFGGMRCSITSIHEDAALQHGRDIA